VTTRKDGSFSRILRVKASTEYRVVWRPAGADASSLQPAIAIVRLRVIRR
jgi:hypothetical protein